MDLYVITGLRAGKPAYVDSASSESSVAVIARRMMRDGLLPRVDHWQEVGGFENEWQRVEPDPEKPAPWWVQN